VLSIRPGISSAFARIRVFIHPFSLLRRMAYLFAGDAAWNPRVPVGHTNYSWGEEVVEEPVAVPPRKESVAKAPQSDAKQKTHEKTIQPEPKPDSKEGGKEKKQKEKKPKQDSKPAAVKEESSPFARVEMKVGKILSARKHENADKLFIETIDVGEPEPRQIVSGLVGHYTAEQLTGHRVIVITNLKPAPLVKVTSYGMVLAAKIETPSGHDGKLVQLVEPPASAKVGEVIRVEGEEGDPDGQVDAKKANSPWSLIFPDLKTDAHGVACYKGKPFQTSGGSCQPNDVKSLVNAQLS